MGAGCSRSNTAAADFGPPGDGGGFHGSFDNPLQRAAWQQLAQRVKHKAPALLAAHLESLPPLAPHHSPVQMQHGLQGRPAVYFDGGVGHDVPPHDVLPAPLQPQHMDPLVMQQYDMALSVYPEEVYAGEGAFWDGIPSPDAGYGLDGHWEDAGLVYHPDELPYHLDEHAHFGPGMLPLQQPQPSSPPPAGPLYPTRPHRDPGSAVSPADIRAALRGSEQHTRLVCLKPYVSGFNSISNSHTSPGKLRVMRRNSEDGGRRWVSVASARATQTETAAAPVEAKAVDAEEATLRVIDGSEHRPTAGGAAGAAKDTTKASAAPASASRRGSAVSASPSNSGSHSPRRMRRPSVKVGAVEGLDGDPAAALTPPRPGLPPPLGDSPLGTLP